jgi:hypothetical protein
MTFSGKMNEILIEPWAIEMMIRQLENEINEIASSRRIYLDVVIDTACAEGERGTWQRLVSLDALRQHYKKEDVKPIVDFSDPDLKIWGQKG